MWNAVLCILIIGGFFILRAILATVFFFYLLPQGDRCPNCDAVTLRIQVACVERVVPEVPDQLVLRMRLARSPAARPASARRPRLANSLDTTAKSQPLPASRRTHGGQLPLNSKKSSK